MNEQSLYAIARRITSQSHSVRTGGTIEFKKDTGPIRRDIRVTEFNWSPDALRDLAKILWATQRAHSYAMSSLRVFSKIPSSEFSPDGLLGGRGYIQSIKDMRAGLADAVEFLSSFTDTVHDEINASHWAQVEPEANISNIVSDAEETKENPEKFVDDEFEDDVEEEEEDPVENPVPSNPEVDNGDDDNDNDDDDNDGFGSRTSSFFDKFSGAFERVMSRVASMREAGGALDELLVPGMEPTITDRDLPGPRAWPLGPASGGEHGNFEDPCCPDIRSDHSDEEQELLLNSQCLPLVDDPLNGSDYQSRMSAAPESYSWLPGSDNRRGMNYYDRNLTQDDIDWMFEHSKPPMPKGILPESESPDTKKLWDLVRE